MSAEAFSKVMKNSEFIKQWATEGFKKTEPGMYTGITAQTRESSKAEIDKSLVDFVLPVTDLEKITNDEVTTQLIVKSLGTNSNPLITLKTLGNVQVLIFNQINFKKAGQQISDWLAFYSDPRAQKPDFKPDSETQKQLSELSSEYFGTIQGLEWDKGHVYGWADTLLERTRADITKVINKSTNTEQKNQELKALDNFIDALLNVLYQYEEAQSSIGAEINATIGVNYKKTDRAWLVQFQGRKEQQAGGSTVGAAIGKADTGVRGFLKNVGWKSGDNMVERALQGMIQGFIKQGISSQGDQNLLQLESSPKIIKLMEDSLMSAATGKPKKYNNEYSGIINDIVKLPIQKTEGLAQSKASIQKAKAELTALKSKVNSTKAKLKTDSLLPQDSTVNLFNLQNLLNLHLQDVVSANMGAGDRKDILNYRTGRFAGSVNVERLVMSRGGMITAFYNYMKYPYATFSEGGKQSRPTSRDPKLLISKSIREIVAQNVTNRLRAVVV